MSHRAIMRSISRGRIPAAKRALHLSLWLALGCAGPPTRVPPGPPSPSPIGPDSFDVAFETSQGRFVVRAHRVWSPLGADRFHELVHRRVYDDLRIYRVVHGFVVQFGLTGDSLVNRAWQARGLPDEPVREPNRRGRMAFARAGPETRSLQVFINLADNTPRLDTLSARGVRGYPPFGEVREGLEVVDRLYAEYGNAPAQRQDSIVRLGHTWLDREYPLLDRILRARVIAQWRH